jgi:hypothetical protein
VEIKKTEELTPVAVTRTTGDGRFNRHAIYTAGDKSYYETWKIPAVPITPLDRFHIVESGEEGLRGITLLSYKYYNRVDLWWFIAAVNDIFCPSVEMKAGIELRIPPIEEVLKYLV